MSLSKENKLNDFTTFTEQKLTVFPNPVEDQVNIRFAQEVQASAAVQILDLGTLGIVPLIAICWFRKWPFFLKAIGVLIVPFWILIHLFKSMAMETRLFLVPQALIFIPALLCLIEYEIRKLYSAPALREEPVAENLHVPLKHSKRK